MFEHIQKIDQRFLQYMGRIHRPILTRIMIAASSACNLGLIWWAVCLPFLFYSPWRYTGFCFVAGLAIAHLMGEIIIKHLVRRTRPCHLLEEEEQLIRRPRFYSFPSGHAAASFAMVGVASLRCRLITFLPIMALASLIGFSRLYLRVHYLTDVVLGAVLGFSCGLLAVHIMNVFLPVLP